MAEAAYEWIYVVDPLDGPGDERIDGLYEVMDAAVDTHGGLTSITVTVKGSAAVEAGWCAADLLSSHGFTVMRTHPDLVTRSDISERAAVTRQAVTNWVKGKRHHPVPFPAPVYAVGGGAWLWGDVSAWLRENAGMDVAHGLLFPTLSDHITLDAILSGLSSVAGHSTGQSRRVDYRVPLRDVEASDDDLHAASAAAGNAPR